MPIPLHEDTMMLRALVFRGDAGVDRTSLEQHAVVAIETSKFLTLYTFEQESACPVCEAVYLPFLNCDVMTWILPACPSCVGDVLYGRQHDYLVDEVSELQMAKAYLIKFDNFCLERPWLINESFAYNRAFVDWCEMHDKVLRERDALRRLVECQLPPAPKKASKTWFSAWFSR